MTFFEKLKRDWSSKKACPPVSFSQSVLDDYDLHMLIQNEVNAIRPNLQALRPAIKEVYIRLGGNYENAKTIFQTIGSYWIGTRLDQTDLPGPDAYLRPKILDMSKDFLAKAFDDFFADLPNVPTIRTDD